MEDKIDMILGSLSLEEKIQLLAGADQWHTHSVERLGIPALKLSDGPNGVRGEGGDTRVVTSASFPVGVAMGATWNPDLIRQVGAALGEEAKDKNAHILLGPTVNTHRAPLAGRNFECFSEDPYLASRMAVSYITGLQEQGVGACVKHFVCNDQEYKRFSISSEVRERALREIYLPPFSAAVQEAGVWTLMSAYNRINGTYASEHDKLLLGVLKGEWTFDGLVVSDWYGTYSENVISSGLDLEMPGPARWMGEEVKEAVEEGAVAVEHIDDKIRRLLRTMLRTDAFNQPERAEERSIDRPQHRRLIRKVGGEALVLLKNEGDLLPLKRDQAQKIALIGANAEKVSFQGGGSSQVSPHYVISPLEAISAVVGETVDVVYSLGCPIHRDIPPIEQDWLRDEDGEEGKLTVRYFDNPDLEGQPVKELKTGSSQLSWFGERAEFFDPNRFSLRLTGAVQVPESAAYTMELGCIGRARLFINGELVLDLWDREPEEPGMGAQETLVMDLEEGRRYPLRMEYASL
ncbi:MAG: glycoside hydrolase family 3 N-terminal domain-containing protein, partial [Chloroflexota bacterium]